jgi:SAM-dependent methyltransferase
MSETGHPRDIAEEDLAAAVIAADRPELLRELVGLGRATFGFFPRYATATIYYPWVAARLECLQAGSRVLEVGPGLSPLPLFVARRGCFVDCVDSHPKTCTLPPQPDWTEWGYFDYATIDSRLRSHHCSILQFRPSGEYDAILAVGVLPHMPRADREETLRRCRSWLRPGGVLLLMLGLLPSTEFLWNRLAKKAIAPPEEHGTSRDVLDQLSDLGFRILDAPVRRGFSGHAVDLFLIHAILEPATDANELQYHLQ